MCVWTDKKHLQRGEVERALNMFEDMTGNGLHPTDVTFNALISACAKRPDYYETAFDLFEQMHTVYNFEPDRITYNILLSACARKRELKRAREIVQTMHAHQQQQSDSMISPDEHTFITLFSCYANYNPPSTQKMTATVKDEAAATLVEHSLFLPILPVRRSQVVEEAKHVYNYIISNKLCDVSSELITAYLDVHITQKRSTECLLIYDHEFAKYNVEHLPKTFSHMLRYAYDTRDSTLAWKVWEDYQEFLESRSARFPDNPDDSIVERKRIQDERTACQRREEWTLAHQRTMLRSMANTLGRWVWVSDDAAVHRISDFSSFQWQRRKECDKASADILPQEQQGSSNSNHAAVQAQWTQAFIRQVYPDRGPG